MPFIEDTTGEVVAGLIAAVTTQEGLDVDATTVLGWLSSRQALMCARSGCLRRRLSIGATVNGQADYPVPRQIVRILELKVNGVIYSSGRHGDIANHANRLVWIWGPGGLVAREGEVGGTEQLALVPAPTDDGQVIEAYATCRPGPIVEGDDATVHIPDEFHDALVDGAIALGLQRMESRGDLAAEFAQRFDGACAELLKQVRKRYKGLAPEQLRTA